MSPTIRRLSFAILFIAGLTSPFFAQSATRSLLPPTAQEVARIASPDRQHEAVIVRTVPKFPYQRPSTEVYVVARGGKITPTDDPVLLASKADGVQSAWKNNHLLEIRYTKARVDGFTAIWPTKSDTPTVEIRLTAPASGLSFAPEDNS
jgi:hypothetical protein